jgi:hypothetical protein
MTVLVAVPEIRRLAPDALRMVGLPQGQADETADMVAWTEAVVGGALRFMRLNRARLLWVPRPRVAIAMQKPGQAALDVRGGSLLEFGIRIFDFLCAEALEHGGIQASVSNTYGTVFLPYLVWRLRVSGVAIECDRLKQSPNSDHDEPPGEIIVRATALDVAGDAHWQDDHAARFDLAVDHGVEVDDDDLMSFNQVFEMLRVPTSERSRTHAG